MFDIIGNIVIKVYYSDITNFEYDLTVVDSFPLLRRDYVNSITDENRKRQSVFAWILLEYALKNEKVWGNFSVDSKGRWRIIDSKIKFSITHSGGIVAVAVTDSEYVGIDVEKCSDKVLKLKNKLGDYNTGNISSVEFLTREWTKKESAYKAGKKCEFFSRKIFDKNGDEYFMTLCTKDKFEDFVYLDCKKLIN